MALVRRSAAAERDYRDIWRYIAERDPDAADRLLRKIDEKLALYAELPGAGSPRESLLPGSRSFPVGSYVVFYRAVSGGIELVRVLHGRRDIRRRDLQPPRA